VNVVTDPRPPATPRKRRVGGEGEPEVFVADEQNAVAIDPARWSDLVRAVLVDEGVRGNTELSLLFVDELSITELNERFMGVDGPTDVLAFPIDASEIEIVATRAPATIGPDRSPGDPAELPLLLGDVVVCPTVAARQAPDHAGTVDDELALLIVHGVLHVLGHDHHEADETAVMRARERALLEAHHWHGPAPAGFRHEQP
jgi:probable rRNA maturation factor